VLVKIAKLGSILLSVTKVPKSGLIKVKALDTFRTWRRRSTDGFNVAEEVSLTGVED